MTKSCSHVAQKIFYFFYIFKKVSVFIFNVMYKKINNKAIKSKRKQMKDHKDTYLSGF